MADEKNPPAAKPDDKTAVDDRRREPASDDERTTVAPRERPARPATEEMDPQSTVMFRRSPAAAAAPPPGEDDRTVVGAVAPRGSLAAAATASCQIVVLSGPVQGKRFPISGSEALIGSNPTCDAAIPGIEAVHVKLVKGASGYEMQNVGSSGSVLLAGGRRPGRARLASGDLMKIGPVVLRFVQMGDVFSPDYSDSEFAAPGLGRFLDPEFLRQNVWYLIGGALLLILVMFWLRR